MQYNCAATADAITTHLMMLICVNISMLLDNIPVVESETNCVQFNCEIGSQSKSHQDCVVFLNQSEFVS